MLSAFDASFFSPVCLSFAAVVDDDDDDALDSSKWYRAGKQLSQEEYEAQGDAYTRQAIAALRESTCEDWSLVKKVSQSVLPVYTPRR